MKESDQGGNGVRGQFKMLEYGTDPHGSSINDIIHGSSIICMKFRIDLLSGSGEDFFF